MSDIDFELLDNLKEYNKQKYYHFRNYIPFEENEQFEKLLSARYMKVSRLKRRFIYLITKCKNLYFVTFTFSDLYINKSDKTHKRLIKNALSTFDINYKIILNADYGTKNERLHFHAIIGTESDANLDKHLKEFYPCFTKTEKIKVSNDSIKKISKYINKLSNHAIKSSTLKSRIFYNFKGFDDLTTCSHDVGIICFSIMEGLK